MERGRRSYWCFLTVLFCHYYSWLLCQYSISLNGISQELPVVWFSFVLQLCFLGFNSSMERYRSIKGWRKREQKGQRRKCSQIRFRFCSPGIRPPSHLCTWTYIVLSVEIRCNGFMWCQITPRGLKQIREVCWSLSKHSRSYTSLSLRWTTHNLFTDCLMLRAHKNFYNVHDHRGCY